MGSPRYCRTSLRRARDPALAQGRHRGGGQDIARISDGARVTGIADGRAVSIAVLTISDTRTAETDSSGRAIRELLALAGHRFVDGAILPDEPDLIASRVREWAQREDVEGIVTNGGTGISGRDRTFEALFGILEQRLDGFGELFRHLSFEEIGSRAMLSRAVAGVVSGKVVFALPGSENAVRLAMTRLILPELGHIVSELRR